MVESGPHPLGIDPNVAHRKRLEQETHERQIPNTRSGVSFRIAQAIEGSQNDAQSRSFRKGYKENYNFFLCVLFVPLCGENIIF